MIFAIEPLKGCWDEIMVLAHKHWNETQAYRHSQPFRPVFERYESYERMGCYVQFTARVEGKLVGYAGLYFVPSMHTQEPICTEDTWYLDPEFRKGWTAIKFFRFMEDECRRRGVVEVTLTEPISTEVGIIHRRLGYKPVATMRSKHL